MIDRQTDRLIGSYDTTETLCLEVKVIVVHVLIASNECPNDEMAHNLLEIPVEIVPYA